MTLSKTMKACEDALTTSGGDVVSVYRDVERVGKMGVVDCLRELIIEARYNLSAAKLTAEVMEAGLDIREPETVRNLCLAHERVGEFRAELEALTGALMAELEP